MASRSERDGPNIYNNEEIRIVLVGKTGAGKSTTGNTILGRNKFKSEFSFKSFTKQCDKANGEVDGKKVAVIDTPGLFDTCEDEKKTKRDIAQSISYASPGPHIFLVVIKLGRFTDEEKKTVQMIQQIFGEEADKYSMVLFTHGDLLEDEPIEELLKEDKDLQELVSRCNGQYHVFSNKLEDRSQVRELLNKIRKITEKNGGSHYTTEMFQKAEKKIEEVKQRILKENEEKRRKEREELNKKMEKEAEEVKQRILKENEEKMRKEREELKKKMEKEAEEEKQRILKENEEKMRKEREELKKKMEKEAEEEKQRILKENEEKMRKAREELKKKMEKEAEEEKQRILKENEEKMRKEREELKKKMEKEAEEEKEEKHRQLREKQEKDARRKAEESPEVLEAIVIGVAIGLVIVAAAAAVVTLCSIS